MSEASYSIAEMAELGGVSRRTVRYYVRRGLIPTPTGTGRGKHYTQHHLDTLIRVRQAQEQGISLASILEGSAPKPPGPAPAPVVSIRCHQETWTRVHIADGVELHLRGSETNLDERDVAEIQSLISRALSRDLGSEPTS